MSYSRFLVLSAVVLIGVSSQHATASHDWASCRGYAEDTLPISIDPQQPKVTSRIQNDTASKTFWVQAKNNHHEPAGENVAPGELYENQTDRHGTFEMKVIIDNLKGGRRICEYDVTSGKWNNTGADEKYYAMDNHACGGDQLAQVKITCQRKFNKNKGKLEVLHTIADN